MRGAIGAAEANHPLSERPLVNGRRYTALDYSSNPDVTAGAPAFTCSEFVGFACGTQIATPVGPRAVEALRMGGMVSTLDRGRASIIR